MNIYGLTIEEMEEYFLSCGCSYILVDVFGYNEMQLNFILKRAIGT